MSGGGGGGGEQNQLMLCLLLSLTERHLLLCCSRDDTLRLIDLRQNSITATFRYGMETPSDVGPDLRDMTYTVEPLYCGHLRDPNKVSCIEMCPHFRGKFLAHLGHSKVSLVQRCPYFRVSFKRGSTVYRYLLFL